MQGGQQVITPTTEEAIEYAQELTPDCWSDEVIKVLFLEAEKHSSAATHYLRRAEKAEAELATERARLDWMQKNGHFGYKAGTVWSDYFSVDLRGGEKTTLRDAIDAAMKETSK